MKAVAKLIMFTVLVATIAAASHTLVKLHVRVASSFQLTVMLFLVSNLVCVQTSTQENIDPEKGAARTFNQHENERRLPGSPRGCESSKGWFCFLSPWFKKKEERKLRGNYNKNDQ